MPVRRIHGTDRVRVNARRNSPHFSPFRAPSSLHILMLLGWLVVGGAEKNAHPLYGEVWKDSYFRKNLPFADHAVSEAGYHTSCGKAWRIEVTCTSMQSAAMLAHHSCCCGSGSRLVRNPTLQTSGFNDISMAARTLSVTSVSYNILLDGVGPSKHTA